MGELRESIMKQIEIKENALPILKQGLALQKKLTDQKLRNYLQRLKKYENQYAMESQEFIKEFEAGNLGDDPQWFDWIFVYEAWKRAAEKKNIIESLSL